MQLVAIGVNHQTAPLAIREQVALPDDGVGQALEELLRLGGVREAAVLSTCNRTEIYAYAEDTAEVVAWLAGRRQLDAGHLQPYLYCLSQAEAARHAFRVASGLDSMVLGETQILGQMKDAVDLAQENGALGTVLHGLFQRTFAAAKAVRTDTDIGAHSVSMAAASVRLALDIFPRLDDLQVLFIGAGEMIELCAAHYHGHKPAGMTIANRTHERGEQLAARFGARFLPLEMLAGELARFDIVVTSTASPLPLLGKGLVERALKVRKHRPMVMVDLAVPRDIEVEVGQLGDVYLYTVDDLSGVVQEGRDKRRGEVLVAERIVDEHVHAFLQWLEARRMAPVIRGLRDHVDRLRRHELERAQKQLARGDDPQLVLEQFAQSLTNKFLHQPTQALANSELEQRHHLVDVISRLYNLDPPAD